MKKYELIRPWHDTVKNELHEKLGEIVEMEDEERANRLVRLGAFKEIVEEVERKEPEVKTPNVEKSKTSKSTTTRKKK